MSVYSKTMVMQAAGAAMQNHKRLLQMTNTAPLPPVAVQGDQKPPRMSDQRFRSFAERYMVARAPLWPLGKETECAWQATLDAKRFYRMIEEQGKTLDNFIKETENHF